VDDWSKYEAVVANRWEYYRPRFERFARGEWLSWNWAAFVATLAWLRYRKLYAWSWAYFFVSTPFLWAVLMVVFVGDACERALDPTPSSVAGVTVLALLFLGWVLPPLAANHLYFKHVQALIGKKDGGTSTPGFIGALALQVLVLIGTAVAVPSYAHYRYRSMVSDGVVLARAAKVALQEYVNEHQRLPARIDEVTREASSNYVDRLVLESDGTIRAIFGDKSEKLSGHSVSFVPQTKDGQIVDWVCGSKDLPDRCLPIGCRQP
jgi:type IV pilus assembly protein PilA